MTQVPPDTPRTPDPSRPPGPPTPLVAKKGGPPLLPSTPQQRRQAFRLLFLCLCCMGMGQTIIFSILPPLAREMGLAEWQVGSIFLASSIVWVVVSPWWGRRSDQWGRRPVILLGLVGFAISTVLFALVIEAALAGWIAIALAWPLMIASRLFYGVLGSGSMPSAQAYIADRTTRAERTPYLAGLGAAFGLGATLGPGLASALVVLGLLAPFYGLAVLALASAAAIWFLLPERTLPQVSADRPRLSVFDPRVRWHLVVGLLMGTTMAIVVQTVGFLFIDQLKLDVHEAAQMVGVGMMASSMAALFAQIVIAQRFRVSAGTLLWSGCVVIIVAFVIFLASRSYGPLVMALVLTGLGSGMARPGNVAAASLAVEPEEQGGVAGLTNATGAAGFILAPLIGLPLYRFDPLYPYWLCLVLSIVTLAIVLRHPEMRQVDVEPSSDDEPGVPGG
ncbi:MFS transporter [Zavarzinia sp. CC-PAN008]|uniref:MFS transporter n=1 Tax=Zavarzinia sp. CC-PAN008 TaxID=3243332 RepID=UPI003F748D99